MAGKCDTVKRDRAACDSAKGDGATPAAPQVIRQVLPARAAPAPGVTALLDAVVEGGWGQMVSLQGTDIVRVPFTEALGELNTVPLYRYEEAAALFG